MLFHNHFVLLCPYQSKVPNILLDDDEPTLAIMHKTLTQPLHSNYILLKLNKYRAHRQHLSP